jgi:hypothetical protein
VKYDQSETREINEILVSNDHKVSRVSNDHKVSRVFNDLRVYNDQRGTKAIQGIYDHKGYKGNPMRRPLKQYLKILKGIHTLSTIQVKNSQV